MTSMPENLPALSIIREGELSRIIAGQRTTVVSLTEQPAITVGTRFVIEVDGGAALVVCEEVIPLQGIRDFSMVTNPLGSAWQASEGVDSVHELVELLQRSNPGREINLRTPCWLYIFRMANKGVH